MPIIRVEIIADTSKFLHGSNEDGSPRFDIGETYDLMQHEAFSLMQGGAARKITDWRPQNLDPPSRSLARRHPPNQ